MIRHSIAALEQQLSPAGFLRVHRGYVVNLEYVKGIEPCTHGDSAAIMASGARVNVSRNFKARLVRHMGAIP